MSSRVGNFSSSEIHKLMSKAAGTWNLEKPGKPFFTYVRDKVWETRLGRSLTQRQNSRITTWGLFVEKIVFDKLGMDYKLNKPFLGYWYRFTAFNSNTIISFAKIAFGDICKFAK